MPVVSARNYQAFKSSYNGLFVLASRQQWPRRLRCGSAAARLLGLWVQTPPEGRMSVYSECFELSGRRLCVGLITRTEETYRVLCV